MAKKPTTVEISETKIRQAIWMMKANKTKKSICEILGIAYNTKRLDAIITEFRDKETRIADLKKKRSKTPFTQSEKLDIVKDYNSGESQSAISERYFASPTRIKSVLIEMNVPLRARSKKGEAKVDHVIQNLDDILVKGSRVFIPQINSFGTIKEVYDEDWIDYYRHPTKRRYVEIQNMEKLRKKFGEDFEGTEDNHYNIYWCYDNGTEWKEYAIKDRIKDVESIIEKTGREHYLIWVEGDHNHFRNENREKIFPVMGN